jgi:hypothetical protein
MQQILMFATSTTQINYVNFLLLLLLLFYITANKIMFINNNTTKESLKKYRKFMFEI